MVTNLFFLLLSVEKAQILKVFSPMAMASLTNVLLVL